MRQKVPCQPSLTVLGSQRSRSATCREGRQRQESSPHEPKPVVFACHLRVSGSCGRPKTYAAASRIISSPVTYATRRVALMVCLKLLGFPVQKGIQRKQGPYTQSASTRGRGPGTTEERPRSDTRFIWRWRCLDHARFVSWHRAWVASRPRYTTM